MGLYCVLMYTLFLTIIVFVFRVDYLDNSSVNSICHSPFLDITQTNPAVKHLSYKIPIYLMRLMTCKLEYRTHPCGENGEISYKQVWQYVITSTWWNCNPRRRGLFLTGTTDLTVMQQHNFHHG